MKKILAISLAILMLSGCAQTKQYRAEYFSYFDTFTEVTFYAPPENVEQIKTVINDVFKKYHELFDSYHSYPNIINVKTINDVPTGYHKIDPALTEIISFALENAPKTGNKVNIAGGAVLDLWHKYRLEGKTLPPWAALRSASSHINMDRISLPDGNIVISDPMLKLDLGSIAKGYVSDKVVAAMKNAGATAGIVNMGGNVISFGSPSDRDYFVAGVQSPTDDGIAAKVSLKDASLVTSGDYQRFYTVNGKKYHHIIDMETLMPGGEFSSVTVLHPSSLTADFLSTTLFLSSLTEGKKIAADYGAQVLWIYPDGSQAQTDGFPLIK